MDTYHMGEWGFNEDSPLGRIDFEGMLKDKQVRAREKMKQHGLAAVICLTEANVEYTTNIPALFPGGAAIGGNRYAIFPAEGTPIGFEECQTALVLRQHLPNIRMEYSITGFGGPNVASAKEAQVYLADEFADQIYSILKENKLEREKIGIDSSIPIIAEALKRKGIDVTLEGGQALFESRAVKTPMELECFRALASIIDGCFATLAKNLRPGVTEREIFAKCCAYALENGLTVNGGFIASGEHTWPKDNTAQATRRRIRPGDVVYADFFNFGFFGYRSCCYRTFSVGRASKEVRETYERVFNWLEIAEKAVKPGATTWDVVKNWPDETTLFGEKPPYIKSHHDVLSTFWMNMGHGLGLSMYEPPFFWRPTASKWPQTLEKNTAIALETLDSTPDARSGVRIEDMLIVTDGGYEIISKWPRDEIVETPLF
ncbi:MAG: M24 family metallopeptidase [Nitrososphaerales archaeon]